MAGKKKYFDTFVSEKYEFDSEEAQKLFREIKNTVGASRLIEAKKEHTMLTVAILESLAPKAEEKKKRLDETDDGQFVCVGKHIDGDKGATVHAKGWTPARSDGTPSTDKNGKILRFGSFFKMSRAALDKSGLSYMLSGMEKTTGEVLGVTAEEVEKRQALIGAACGLHIKKFRDADLIRYFTDKASVLAQAAEAEEYFTKRTAERAVRDEEDTLLAEAAAKRNAARAEKAEKSKDGGRRGAEVSFTFAGVTLSAPVHDRRFKEGLEALLTEYKGRELEFSQLDPSVLIRRGVPAGVAGPILRRIKTAVTEGISKGATLQESADANKGQHNDKDRQREERRRRKEEKEKGGAKNWMKEVAAAE